MLVLVALGAVASTLGGGAFALRHRAAVRLILGLTAGVVLGVVSFDLIPELFALTQRTGIAIRSVMIAVVVAFLVFHGLEKLLLAHHGGEEDRSGHAGTDGAGAHHPSVGLASAVALCGHSVADGVAIGLAFQVNPGVGAAVAIAVIGHDFADGLNTVSLMLAHGNTGRRAALLLLADAVAPVVGAASTFALRVPDAVLLFYLGCFTGFLLYIGASEILPEAHSPRPSPAAVALTVVGVAAMYAVTGVLP